MINWNKELVETILNEIRDKNASTSSYIQDIYAERADSIDRAINIAENRADELTDYVEAILDYLVFDNEEELKDLLGI